MYMFPSKCHWALGVKTFLHSCRANQIEVTEGEGGALRSPHTHTHQWHHHHQKIGKSYLNGYNKVYNIQSTA